MPATLDRPVRPQWIRALRWQMARLSPLLLAGWAALIASLVVVLATLSLVADEVMVSAMSIAVHVLLWFPFSVAIIIAVSHLPVHVAGGMTRQSFTRAALVWTALIAVANSVVSIVLIVIERAAYERLGWVHAPTDGAGAAVLEGGPLLYGLGLALLFSSGMLSGLLAGTTYYRFGGWWGILALPLTLSPIFITSAFALNPETQWTPWDLTVPGPVQGNSLVALVVLALAAAAFALLVRRIPIHAKQD